MRNDLRPSIYFRLKRIFFRLGILAILLSFPLSSHAQLSESTNSVQNIAQAAGVSGGTDLIVIIGRIINVFLGTLGVVFLGLMLYAGFLWMTSGGDDENVKKAKSMIQNAIIGLLIIMSSWAITYFIIKALTGATGGGSVIGTGSGGFGGLIGSSGSLGSGIIEYHLPERNATDIPRNTPVIITFKQPIQPASFIEAWTESASGTLDGLNTENIKIFRTGDEGTALVSSQARVSFTQDHKTFVIRPVDFLGSAKTNTKYTVKLKGGNTGILLETSAPAFAGSFGGGYEWGFEVSTFVDTTPPKVLSVFPADGGQTFRNAVIQITFDEAVDPTGATGIVKGGEGFTNISVQPQGGGSLLDGEYRISNRYRTVEFLTNDKCGVNSCGKDVFCLPPSATLEVKAQAAPLSKQPPLAELTSSGYGGITDIVGNSLDGNGDSVATGPDGPPVSDNFIWSFGTNNAVKLTPPVIQETFPEAVQSNIPLDENVTATFDSIMQASSFTSQAARIEPKGPQETDPDTFWYYVGMTMLTAQNLPVQQGDVAVKSQLFMKHRPYIPSSIDPNAPRNDYNPFLLSDLQDGYQNCFNPSSSGKCDATKGGPNCCNNSPSGQDCKF
jgi:hypothetical protein